MAVNTSPKWQIDTVQAGATLDPPRDYKNIVADIESRAAGAPQLVANLAGRNAIPTAQLYNGKRVSALDTRTEWEWNGTSWDVRREDTGWVNIAVDAAYTNGTGTNALAARRIGNAVYLRGQPTRVTGNVTLNDNIGTIPDGYNLRPVGGSIALLFAGAGVFVAKGVVTTNGIITIGGVVATPASPYVRLDAAASYLTN